PIRRDTERMDLRTLKALVSCRPALGQNPRRTRAAEPKRKAERKRCGGDDPLDDEMVGAVAVVSCLVHPKPRAPSLGIDMKIYNGLRRLSTIKFGWKISALSRLRYPISFSRQI